ncbi:carbohydrate ABC transporter permease [Microbacterium sp. A93]|uniref:carbohydrate ABC transporter permease n=1 Tax=Microbacterium sp. A93 TaxID=3450716 RepID=UPI003F427BE2
MTSAVQTRAPRAGVTATSSPRRRRPRRRLRIAGYGFVLPALALYIIFAIIPAVQTLQYSLYDWNGISPSTWVGFENYVEVFADERLRRTLLNALILVAFFSILPIGIGLLVAGIVAKIKSRWMTAARVLLFLPQIFPLVVVGIVWRWMYADSGPLNELLRAVGLESITRAWLADFGFALVAVGLIGTWVMTGLCMLLFSSGVQKIDHSLYEAARLDGAGPVQEFFAVTLPGLRGEIRVALTITIVAALASFDLVFTTTNGGPADRTLVPSLVIYRLAFTEHDIGLASAVGACLSAMILAVVLIVNRITREE